MSETVEVRVPDIGDFTDVPVIEVLVKAGDEVAAEDPLVTLESDKATMDVPSPAAGTVREVSIAVGDTVSEGAVILTLDGVPAEGAPAEHVAEEAEPAPADAQPSYGSDAGVYEAIEVHVPDIGDFSEVPVIDVLVHPGDTVAVEDPLITLESDKATMDVPSPVAGTVRELRVAVGDAVSEGTAILVLEGAATSDGGGPAAPPGAAPAGEAPAPAAPPPSFEGTADMHAEVVVLGAGPGGYTAAFRAADLGLKTILIERYERLGGVCLNVGCIPSKALLHVARVIAEAEEAKGQGVGFGDPQIELDGVRSWKDSVVDRLTGGLGGLARQRKVDVVRGVARFTSPNVLRVDGADGATTVSFDRCIIAAGSSAVRLPDLPDDPRIIDSTGALELEDVPDRLLIVGGGIIGLEMATVYDALGSQITVVELMDQLIPGADKDLIRPLQKRIEQRYESILLKTRVARIEATDGGLRVSFEGDGAPEPQTFDRVLLAVGRRPNGRSIGAEAAGVFVDERGFIPVDRQMRTNVPHIHAIGDVVGEPMLAHKATHEGKVAAEVAAGHHAEFDAKTIPSVAYTDPEVAWMGLTETQAKADGVEFEKASFPWVASGRALSLGRDEGVTKLLFEPGSRRLLGAGIVGPNAGELIAEAVLALEMGADAEDLSLTIHPHPTLSETLGFAAEMAEGTITDLMPPRRR
ncbi:MAG: dihydrolipoamide dehydrogenase [Solirubrobacteraceae bacterium]|nr:dihydrolipoamide dehydrogenase [Solirubrobacteraceae bacterium]